MNFRMTKENNNEDLKKDLLTGKSFYEKELIKEPFQYPKNVLIIGAGTGGKLVLREIRKNKNYKIQGFVDDNENKIGKKLGDFKIYGKISDFSKILSMFNRMKIRIDQAIITMPSVEGYQIKEITEKIFNKIPKISILPTVYEDPISIRTGIPVPGKIRDIQIEDFFRRKPILLPFAEISSKYKDKIILITGAGGSIGSELCKQLIMFSPKRIILLDNSEFSLYNLQKKISNL